jgi:hypothetical protein
MARYAFVLFYITFTVEGQNFNILSIQLIHNFPYLFVYHDIKTSTLPAFPILIFQLLRQT